MKEPLLIMRYNKAKKSLNAPQAWWPLLSRQSTIVTLRKKTTKENQCTVISQQITAEDIQKVVFFLHMQSKARSQAKPKYYKFLCLCTVFTRV